MGRGGWNGSGVAVQRGQATVSVSASAVGTLVVTFPVEFAVAPQVLLTVVGTGVYHPYLTATAGTTQMTIGVRHLDNTSATASVPVNWEAKPF